MTPIQLNIDFANAAKEAGIKQAVDHAGDDWKEAMRWNLVIFIGQKKQGDRFSCEDFRAWLEYQDREVYEPPTARAYGGIMIWARNSGLIRHTGQFIQTKSVTAHRATAALWEKI